MKKILTVSAIIIIVILIIAVIATYTINTYLVKKSDQNEKAQYELMIQTVEENSDYYENFAIKFITKAEEFGYDQNSLTDLRFELFRIDRNEIEYNNDLLIGGSIRHNKGVRYVVFEYPARVRVFYSWHNFTAKYFHDTVLILYIPDEYMNEASIVTLSEYYHQSLIHIKDKLFYVTIPGNKE
jgi:hypothetical protein